MLRFISPAILVGMIVRYIIAYLYHILLILYRYGVTSGRGSIDLRFPYYGMYVIFPSLAIIPELFLMLLQLIKKPTDAIIGMY